MRLHSESIHIKASAESRKACTLRLTPVNAYFLTDCPISCCGTWELLADAICKDGHKGLIKKGWQAVGEQKSIWAKSISPHMDITVNKSPSFLEMFAQLRSVAT